MEQTLGEFLVEKSKLLGDNFIYCNKPYSCSLNEAVILLNQLATKLPRSKSRVRIPFPAPSFRSTLVASVGQLEARASRPVLRFRARFSSGAVAKW